jgi:hypothetical protein
LPEVISNFRLARTGCLRTISIYVEARHCQSPDRQ